MSERANLAQYRNPTLFPFLYMLFSGMMDRVGALPDFIVLYFLIISKSINVTKREFI